jgi:2,3-dihydroxybiphenyl 1,2-dioxygenase
MEIRALSYVGIEATDVDAWASFATEFLGMPSERDGERLRLRMDERVYRFDIRAGTSDRLAWLGWEVGSAADLASLEARLGSVGVETTHGSAEDAKDRGVVDLIRFSDPAGNRLEAFYGQEADFRPLTLTRSMDGYLTDQLGMGHAVIGVKNYREAFDFYVGVLGFLVSDTFKNFIAFLHCNPRHHSLALVGTDEPGLRHVMLETRSIDDVGTAIDIAKRRGELTRTLGRHTNDKAVSFYVETPGGWEIEYGWSGLQLDDEVAIVRQLAGPTSLWGHELVGGRELMTTAKG